LYSLVCYILSAAALTKGLVGIFAHEKLYTWAEGHYAREKRSVTVIFLLIYGFLVLGLSWYAAFFDYVRYGWVLTAFITLSSVKLVALIFNWEAASQKFVDFIKNGGAKLKILDLLVTVLGFAFLWLGLVVF
jgi:hypothetical protein